jgi:hypothetical protein
MANNDVDDIGYPFTGSLDSAVERCGTLESCQQQAPSMVRLYFYLQYACNIGDNLYFRIRQEEIIAISPERPGHTPKY